MNKRMTSFFVCVLLLINLHAQYISEVLEYKPAPGQFINAAPWGLPDNDNPNVSIVGRLNGALSLGAFGGYVVFKFDGAVDNHKDNPYGIDFVIYGNPLKNMMNSEVPNRVTWSEPGIVSVMKDENGNGLADDVWYELAGSEYFFSSTIKDYQVSYTNPQSAFAAEVEWSDNRGMLGKVNVNGAHSHAYYPSVQYFPNISQDQYTLTGTRIAANVDSSKVMSITGFGRAWGYADNTLRKAYNGLPDNPYTRAMNLEEEGSGGDAFDIDWAVDKEGNYVDLDRIDFVKVHCAVLADAGWLGEVSTEITGAFDVAPDTSVKGELDMIVIKELPKQLIGSEFQLEAFAYHKGRWQKDAELVWQSSREGLSVSNTNTLQFNASGKVTLTASLKARPEISASVSTDLVYEEHTATSLKRNYGADLIVYPNPVSQNLSIRGVAIGRVEIYRITGERVLEKEHYRESEPIAVSHLTSGIYLVKVLGSDVNKTKIFLKE